MTLRRKQAQVDFSIARIDPTLVFRDPEDVLTRYDFSKKQKIEVLKRWIYDARELAVAEEENMGGGESDLLDRLLAALHTLTASNDDNYGTTKT